ncbi:MAG: hypothetical protein FD123_880 [Bacteroidetes bacterium]|nr:MAG: hypothetical protein FD123_880 [Bacteroidota bacterium]
MASFSTRPAFPNILLVTGADVFQPHYRERIREFFNNLPPDTTCPVRIGSHDFWITYRQPSEGGGEHCCSELGLTPRKMRGKVRMGGVPPVDINNVNGHINVMMQEVGHHWLVPSNLTFNIGGAVTRMPTDAEITTAINDETPFTGPAILARDNSHYSAYFQADGSPLDGLFFRETGTEDGYGVWTSESGALINIDPAGLPAASTSGFCDLDLLIMGVKTAAEAYAGTGNKFKWIEPRLTSALPYHTGIFVAFGRHDQLQFGFYEDHRKLAVVHSDGTILGQADIGPDYKPLGHDFTGMSLRIIRRGNDYFFQAKIENPVGGCLVAVLKAIGLYKGELKGTWDNSDTPDPVGAADFKDWKTVAVVNKAGSPVAVGNFVNKKDHPHMCDAAFYNFHTKVGTATRTFQTSANPPIIPMGEFASLSRDRMHRENPVGAIFRIKGGRQHIIAPFSIVSGGVLEHLPAERFRHDATLDSSPKILMKPPADGDFGVATHAKVHRTIYTPWAGGYAFGKTVWGTVNEVPAASVIVPPDIIRDKQPAPPGNAYKCAFILVAANDADITDDMVERLDKIRRYWDNYFGKATVNRRSSDSAL